MKLTPHQINHLGKIYHTVELLQLHVQSHNAASKHFPDVEIIRPAIRALFDENKTNKDLAEHILVLEKSTLHEAKLTLGFCYELGFGVTQDAKRAAEIYAAIGKTSYAQSMYMLALMHALDDESYSAMGLERIFEDNLFAGKRTYWNDDKLVAEYYIEAANLGHKEAQVALGQCYLFGRGVVKDSKLAAERFAQAAKQGNAEAQFCLACHFQEGNGVTQNLEQARELLLQAAEQGYTNGQYFTALYCLSGKGGAQDLKLAAEYFEKAANQGHNQAKFFLGDCYFKGEGVVKDLKRGIELFVQVAMDGDTEDKDAKNTLRTCYRLGIGVTQNQKRSIILVELTEETLKQFFNTALADQEDDFLGFCYQFGLGIKPDVNLAVKHYHQAIPKGKACFWDIFFCYRSIKASSQTILQFTRLLEQYAADNTKPPLQSEALSCLAYCYERGIMNLSQNLFTASALYQRAMGDKSLTAVPHNAFAKEKSEHFSTLVLFEKSLTQAIESLKRKEEEHILIPDAISIVTEYAFESNPKTNGIG